MFSVIFMSFFQLFCRSSTENASKTHEFSFPIHEIDSSSYGFPYIYTGMTLGISKLLQPDSVDLTDADKRRLLGLQRRVQCMVQPLNFLLLWSKSRDDRVQQVVLTAQELLSLGSFGLAQTWRLFGGFRAEKRRRGLVRRRFPSFSLGFRRKM